MCRWFVGAAGVSASGMLRGDDDASARQRVFRQGAMKELEESVLATTGELGSRLVEAG